MSGVFPAGNCGIYCPGCHFYGQPCGGCGSAPGGAFHWSAGTKCDIYVCTGERGLEHCGLCVDFPCDTLLSYAYHPTEGDRERLGHCVVRAKLGTPAWLEKEAAQRAARAAKANP